MPVISFSRKNEGRRGGDNIRGIREYTDVWDVRVSGPDVGIPEILADPRCPKRLSGFPGDPAALLLNRIVSDADDTWLARDLTLEYSTEIPQEWLVVGDSSGATAPTGGDGHPSIANDGVMSPSEGQPGIPPGEGPQGGNVTPVPLDDPLKEPPVVRWGGQFLPRGLFVDSRGNIMMNSSEEMFEPPREVDDGLMLLHVERNVRRSDPLFLNEYYGAVNKKTFRVRGRSFDPGSVRCMNIQIEERYEKRGEGIPVFFCHESYDFLIKQRKLSLPRSGPAVPPSGDYTITEKWHPEWILDQGYRTFTPANNPPWKVVRDESGAPVTKPVMLDGAGGRILNVGLEAGQTKSYYLLRYPFRELDFGALRL